MASWCQVQILIADDDPLSRRLLQATLSRLGHDVVSVANGIDAQEALLRADGPRLAILDWMMPGADGLSVCRAVRRRVGPYAYIILLTARDRREDMVEALNAEVDDFLTKPFDPSELQARIRSAERLLQMQETLLRTQEALRYQATHDHLTGLWNRATILEQCRTELTRATDAGTPIAIVLADLDHFKAINDTHGHAVGDAILRQTARRMTSALRKDDSIGRYGGEEFLIVLPGCDGDLAMPIAERVRASIAALEPDGEVRLPVSISLGVASTRTAREPVEALIQIADDALYRAKAAGRNRIAA
jgi:two-component system, cell cycle response regulator